MSRPLNFLHLSTFYPPYSFGGDAMYIYRLAHALGDLGHTVDVLHNVDAYEFYARAELPAGFPDHPNVTRHGLRSRLRRVSPLITHQVGQPLLHQKQIRALFQAQPYD